MDLGPYLARLALLLPLLCGLIVVGLWAAKRYVGLGAAGTGPALRVVGAATLGPGARLAVVAFADRHLLVSVGRSGTQLLWQTPAPLEPAGVVRAE